MFYSPPPPVSFCSDPLGLVPRGWEQGAVEVTVMGLKVCQLSLTLFTIAKGQIPTRLSKVPGLLGLSGPLGDPRLVLAIW